MVDRLIEHDQDYAQTFQNSHSSPGLIFPWVAPPKTNDNSSNKVFYVESSFYCDSKQNTSGTFVVHATLNRDLSLLPFEDDFLSLRYLWPVVKQLGFLCVVIGPLRSRSRTFASL